MIDTVPCRTTRRWCWRTWGPSRLNTQRCALRWGTSQLHRKSPWTPSETTSAVSWSWSNISNRLLMWRYPHKQYIHCSNTVCTQTVYRGERCGKCFVVYSFCECQTAVDSLSLCCPCWLLMAIIPVRVKFKTQILGWACQNKTWNMNLVWLTLPFLHMYNYYYWLRRNLRMVLPLPLAHSMTTPYKGNHIQIQWPICLPC